MIGGRVLLAAGLFTGALWTGRPDPAGAMAWTAAITRPAILPFLWRSLADAARSGDAAEALAKARLLLRVLPGWADGHMVFAYRFALDGADLVGTPAERAQDARRRLDTALAMLEEARASCPDHEVSILTSMAFLIEVASNEEPGLAALLPADPFVMADALLAEAEHRSGDPYVRENRLFLLPQLVAALLRGGDPARAREVLDLAIVGAAAIRERALADEWRDQLRLLRHWLDDRATPVQPLRDDPRFHPVLPFLR